MRKREIEKVREKGYSTKKGLEILHIIMEKLAQIAHSEKRIACTNYHLLYHIKILIRSGASL